MAYLKSGISWLFIFPVKLYQWILSPLFPDACRYSPTCSAYMIEAIHVHGPFKGFWLGTRRISRCHPWGGSGNDPVPPKKSSPCQHTSTETSSSGGGMENQ